MDNTKNLKKTWLNSLSFLDNCTVNSVIVVILLLYSSQIFSNINIFVGNFYRFAIIRLIVLFLIIYVAMKDTTIAILLTISYIVSLHFMMYNENFVSGSGTNEEQSSMIKSIVKEKVKSMIEEEIKDKIKAQMSKEHFFPMQNNPDNGGSFDPQFEMPKKIQKKMNKAPVNNSSSLTNEECMQLYTPRFEELSNVCEPVATFKDEFNAQGLNYPQGHYSNSYQGSDLNIMGHPLN